MPYTAAALHEAARPITITIGRASSRPGRRWAWWRWLTSWAVRTFRTWSLPPISCRQMLSLQAARRDPVAYLAALLPILRAQIPRRWWYRLTGDPVALLLRLPKPLLDLVLSELMTIPGTTDDGTADEDPMEQLKRLQRKAVQGSGRIGGAAPTLAVASLTVREALGHGWYYAPGEWPTTDGYAPFGVVWVEFMGLQALHARRTLEVADGYTVAQAKDGRRARRELQSAAYPAEVC